MDCTSCCKYGTLNVPVFLSIYNSMPTRTKIYFPDSYVDSLDACLVEREERSTNVNGTLVLPWFHTSVAPRQNLGITAREQVPHTSTFNFINSRSSSTQTTSDAIQVSVIKGVTNQLAHEVREGEHTSKSTIKTIPPQNSCRVDSSLFSDTVRQKQVQVHQNQKMEFSYRLVEENQIVKHNPEAFSLPLDQLPCKYKRGSRANAWKGPSYTELITAAITSTEDRKMTVSQIYNWIIQNIPYFKDREHYESYRGWKNAVRHTLSLRQRFVKLPRTNANSPWYNSWWTISEKHFQHKRPGRKPKAKN